MSEKQLNFLPPLLPILSPEEGKIVKMQSISLAHFKPPKRGRIISLEHYPPFLRRRKNHTKPVVKKHSNYLFEEVHEAKGHDQISVMGWDPVALH